ncbi:hypothetical protein [Streptomyces sp. NBC_00258]|uniref:hypothetical protein n=1 Tax=Streptomyces sp. NBC_00258 TaxID=2903642 RepID=UPI002E2C76AE|nr:hypothetical protein [Streptomyces sp. NBC_00258]
MVTERGTEDRDLRWVLPTRPSRVFPQGLRPRTRAGGVRREPVLLVAQRCPERAWTARLIAVDDLGRITPHRTPLGNESHTSEHPHAEKVVASPR